jgi:hypothetical protein
VVTFNHGNERWFSHMKTVVKLDYATFAFSQGLAGIYYRYGKKPQTTDGKTFTRF